MNILPFQPISTLHVIVVLKWGCCGCCRLKLWKGDNQHVRNQAPTRRGRGGNWCTKWINCYWSWCFPKGIIQQWSVTCYSNFWLIKSLLKSVVFLSFEEMFALYHTIIMWSYIVLCLWNWWIYENENVINCTQCESLMPLCVYVCYYIDFIGCACGPVVDRHFCVWLFYSFFVVFWYGSLVVFFGGAAFR